MRDFVVSKGVQKERKGKGALLPAAARGRPWALGCRVLQRLRPSQLGSEAKCAYMLQETLWQASQPHCSVWTNVSPFPFDVRGG